MYAGADSRRGMQVTLGYTPRMNQPQNEDDSVRPSAHRLTGAIIFAGLLIALVAALLNAHRLPDSASQREVPSDAPESAPAIAPPPPVARPPPGAVQPRVEAAAAPPPAPAAVPNEGAQTQGADTADGAPPGWHAALDAAKVRFLTCVQSLRSPSWAEFTEPPPGSGPEYNAWSQRFLVVMSAASEQCQRQEPRATAALCELMQQAGPLCQTWLNALAGDVMSGRTICDATHCVSRSP